MAPSSSSSSSLPDAWKKLQNGSDIRGVAVAGGAEAVNLTDDHAAAIAAAFGTWLLKRPGKTGRGREREGGKEREREEEEREEEGMNDEKDEDIGSTKRSLGTWSMRTRTMRTRTMRTRTMRTKTRTRRRRA